MPHFASPSPGAQPSSAELPPLWRLSSAVGWALVFWVVGHVAAPVLKGAADGCDHEMGAWTSSQLNHVITGNPDLSGIVFGIILAIIQILVVVAFGAFVMALALLAIGVGLLDQFFASALLGFLFGWKPGRHAQPFRPLAQALEGGGKMLGASVQVFTYPRLGDKLWAITPLVVGIAAAALLWIKFPAVLRAMGHEEQGAHRAVTILRYEPGPGWEPAAGDPEIKIRLERIELEPGRLACTLLFRVPPSRSASIAVDGRSFIRPLDRTKVLTGQELSLVGDDGRVAVKQPLRLAGGDSREATYFFVRPTAPEDQWILFLQFRKNGQPLTARLIFDLREKAP